MNAAQVLDHFDRISDTPDAIPLLRRFILDLAVRGKLVEQDPDDEPTSELLKRIQAEKARLVKDGKIGKHSLVKDDAEAELPFLVPETWEWTPATYPTFLISDLGKKIQTKDVLPAGKFPVVDQGKMFIRGYCNDSDKVIYVKEPVIIFGDHTRETKLVDFDFVVGADGVKILKPIQIVPSYYFLTLQWLPLDSRGYSRHFKLLRAMKIPLPPLPEQHRIVTKVDELMALCDRLEAAQAERESRRDRVTAASLHRLNNGADVDEFREHARFHLRHLPRLTTRPEHIQQLRQTILNLAVRGKLVPQDPDDEPASAVGISSPKGSRGRGVEERPEDDAWPNEVPSSWKWHRLGSISEQVTDGEHATPPRIDDEQVPLVTAKNVRDGFMDYGKTDWVSFETAKKAWVRCRPTVGDVLLVCVGATTGRLCVLREPRDMVLVRSVALIRPTSAINVDYLALALRSPMCQAQMWEKVKMTAQPCLYINRINSLPIPLPPLAEQYRIVAKVEELMALCDRLEVQLTTTQTESRRLLETVLYEALDGGQQ